MVYHFAMSADIHDTYFFLLDQPDHRRLDLCAYHIEYRTPSFEQAVYEAARGIAFSSADDAYRDWLAQGRTQGLPYAQGKDTLLKIMLKVKDEPELIVRWIEHHADIVGYHNLVIMNCGSTDPFFLGILHGYRERVLVLDYDQYYDNLSFPGANAALYGMLMRNCKYLTILDADEFLCGQRDGVIAHAYVKDILRAGSEDVHAGTWLTNTAPPPDTPAGGIDFSSPIAFSLDDASLREGTFAGKSVVRASLVFDINYVGHNLHLRQTMARMDAGSFGKLLVFHLARLSPKVVRARALKHLHAKGIVPPELAPDQVEGWLAQRLAAGTVDDAARVYVDRFMATGAAPEAQAAMTTHLLGGTGPEAQPDLAAALARIDFAGLLRDAFDRCAITLR